ncbi:hypothetical protein H6P81_017644 [Aristolochia fimbriata]|uniref:DUF7795 domain-containing protein n=1 Tax=Aristolochia fimbriata TaxID=158543 RepID=A0AAV7E0R0_ARIFI|nr:hypothetical protein H6P81_017644 [Aristolochia fimbriata]
MIAKRNCSSLSDNTRPRSDARGRKQLQQRQKNGKHLSLPTVKIRDLSFSSVSSSAELVPCRDQCEDALLYQALCCALLNQSLNFLSSPFNSLSSYVEGTLIVGGARVSVSASESSTCKNTEYVMAAVMCQGHDIECEEKDMPSELASKAQRLFMDFMKRIVKFDELATIGSKLIAGFRRELESFRRPPLHKTSELVDRIIETNVTERMKRYVAAGCRHVYDAAQNVNKLSACIQGLQDHLVRVELLLHELEYVSADVAGLLTSSKETSHSSVHNNIWCNKDDAEPYHHRCLQMPEYAVIMRIVLNMYELDYKMQEMVVESLNYNSSPEELDSYCLMWDLRPHINEEMLHQAWKLIPENCQQSLNT